MLEDHGTGTNIPPLPHHLNSSGWAETIASEKRPGKAETPQERPPPVAPPSLTTGTGRFDRGTFKIHSPDNEAPRGAQSVLDGNGPKPSAESMHFDFVYDPSSQANKDVSTRLQLDIEPDWQGDLEEFCRLKRMGLINQAKKHFWSALGHVSTRPYIRVQYAEMLQACGDYKGFQALPFPNDWYPPLADGTPDDRNMGKLVANYALLDLLSQHYSDDYLQRAWQVVRHTLKALAHELSMGSTEVRSGKHVFFLFYRPDTPCIHPLFPSLLITYICSRPLDSTCGLVSACLGSPNKNYPSQVGGTSNHIRKIRARLEGALPWPLGR